MDDLNADVERLGRGGTGGGDEPCLSLGDAVIRPSDIETLELGEWIGDAILAFVFEGLALRLARGASSDSGRGTSADSKAGPSLAIWAPAIVELLTSMLGRDVDDYEVTALVSLFPSTQGVEALLLPVSDRYDGSSSRQGTHWSFVFVSFHTGDDSKPHLEAWHVDSLSPANSPAARTVVEALARLLLTGTPKVVELRPGRRQENASDCGAYVLLGASTLVDHLITSSSTRPIPDILDEVAAELQPAPVAEHRAALHSWLVQLNKFKADD